MHSRATDRRSAPKCEGKWPDQTLDQALGIPQVSVAVSTSRLSSQRAGKTRTLMSVRDSSGESRFRSVATHGLPPAHVEERRREPLIRPHPQDPLSRLARTKQVVHIADLREEE